MLFQHLDWSLTHHVLLPYILPSHPASYEFERPALEDADTLLQI